MKIKIQHHIIFKIILYVIGAMLYFGQNVIAQTAWPSQKPIKLISVFPAGGAVDQVARILAPALQSELNQSIIVENISGASGIIGTAAMANSAADGYTFAIVFDTHGVNPSIKDKLPYDTIKDIAPVILIGTSPMVIMTSKNSGIKTFRQLADESKTKKKFNYGTTGVGSLAHLSMAKLSKDAGFDWNHIPYRGGAQLKQDIVGNQLQLATGSVFFAKSHIDNGDLIPLAVTTNTRARELPNVPTIDEQGFSGFNTSAWFAVLAPADTPPAIINAMNKAINKILKSEEVSNKLKVQGIDIVGGSPEKATSWIGKQIGFWGKFVIENNIKEN